MSYAKGEIDIELLQLQAAMEEEQLLRDKSPEYREGFLHAFKFMSDFTKELYEICDRMAKEVDNDH